MSEDRANARPDTTKNLVRTWREADEYAFECNRGQFVAERKAAVQRFSSIALVLAITIVTLLVVAIAAGAPDMWAY